ncbi:MAG TPA: PDZ domain-containing protein [Nitrososphaera sp.]|nr:PDZ domain-containing protein [Nitrososphaera sp.]
MHIQSPITAGISFALLIGAVGAAFAYVSANPLDIIQVSSEPWFGFRGTPLTSRIAEASGLDPQQQGFLVAAVEGGSPSEEAGLKGGSRLTEVDGVQVCLGGDLITSVNGEPITTVQQLRDFREQSQVGDRVVLTVLRDNEQSLIPVTLGEDPHLALPPLQDVCK